MKRMMITVLVLSSVLLSMTAFADRMVLSGRPTGLLSHPGFYTFPSSYRITPGYRFIVLNNVRRVCFMNIMPQFSSLDVLPLMFQEQGIQVQWNCYQYDPRFFEIDF